MEVSKFGKNIRDYRLNQGIGLRELARKIGMSPASINTIEKGTTSPTIATLDRILKGLGTDLTDFFSNNSNGVDLSPVFPSKECQSLSDGAREYIYLFPKRSDLKFRMMHETINP